MQSLYIHVPFCRAKCDYCAFYSETDTGDDLQNQYLRRLAEELAQFTDQLDPLRSVYVGGGTPVSLQPAKLAVLFDTIDQYCPVARNLEFTVEANPGSLPQATVELLAGSRCNRVSLGVQSFHPRLRRVLGRQGTLDTLTDKMIQLRESGIDNLSLDLIYGIPGQSLRDWREDLHRCLELHPTHVSTYCLSMEPGTALSRKGLDPLDDGPALDMWAAADEILNRGGLSRYEISNFAAPGYQCRHNLAIWYGARFAGAGPAAHWFDGTSRWGNPADLQRWLAGAPPDADKISPAARAREILVTGLRLTKGWDRRHFQQVTGFDYSCLCDSTLEALASDGLLQVQNERLRATPRGLLLADYLARQLLAP